MVLKCDDDDKWILTNEVYRNHMDALTEFAMSFNADGLDDSSHVLMTFVSQRSPGGSEPRNRQRSQDDSGNYGQVRHTHHESSKMNIFGKNRILFLTFIRFRDLPPDPTECGCLKTLVRDKIL